MNIRKWPLVFLLLSSRAFGAEPDIFPGTDLAHIFNKPAVIASSVTWETPEGQSQWITMDVDVHVFTDKPFELLRATAEDLESYPRIFKRLKRARVIRSGGGVFFEMGVSVGLTGITYDTNYTMRVTKPIHTPSRFMLDYAWHAGDGLVRDDAHGQWYLESASVNGIEGTYVRCTVHGAVLKKYPLQGEVMRMFVNLEHEDILKQFLKAVPVHSK
jgi:hypothetical protein